MRLKLVIDKKHAFMILGGILILAGAIYVYAQSPSIFGHSSDEITVSLGTTEMSLQAALDWIDGDLNSLVNALDSLNDSSLKKCRVCIKQYGNSDTDGPKKCSSWTQGIEHGTGVSSWAEGANFGNQAWIECRT